jgi:hypothetical protein
MQDFNFYFRADSINSIRVALMLHTAFFLVLFGVVFIVKKREDVFEPREMRAIAHSKFEPNCNLAYNVARDTLVLFAVTFIMTITGTVCDTASCVMAWIGVTLSVLACILALATGNSNVTGVPALIASAIFFIFAGMSFRLN